MSAILGSGVLKPQHCRVFSKDLLYFSYGGVFYRSKFKQTQDVVELPIAFLFSPRLLDEIATVYPFDTGAMQAKVFGDDWLKRLEPIDTNFEVKPPLPEAVTKVVHHLYGSNAGYLHGEPDPSCAAKGEPLPLLFEFLADDLTSLSADHRQRAIECIAEGDVAIGKYLIWAGFPKTPAEDVSTVLSDIYRWTKPDVPDYWAYPYTKNFNPLALGQALEAKAEEYKRSKYLMVNP